MTPVSERRAKYEPPGVSEPLERFRVAIRTSARRPCAAVDVAPTQRSSTLEQSRSLRLCVKRVHAHGYPVRGVESRLDWTNGSKSCMSVEDWSRRPRRPKLADPQGTAVDLLESQVLRLAWAEGTLGAMYFCPKCGQPVEPSQSRCSRCLRPTSSPEELAPISSARVNSTQRGSIRAPRDSVRPVSRRHGGEWQAIRRSETLAGCGPQPIAAEESAAQQNPIVPAPVVTVLGVPVPSPRSSVQPGSVSPERTIDVGVAPALASDPISAKPIEILEPPAYRTQSKLRRDFDPVSPVARGPVTLDHADRAAVRSLTPVGISPTERVARGDSNGEAIRRTPLPRASGDSEGIAFEGELVPVDAGTADRKGEAIVPYQVSRHAVARSDGVGRKSAAPVEVEALFYRLDGDVLGPSSSSCPVPSRWSSKPPMSQRAKATAPPRRRRWIWGVLIVLFAVGAAFAWMYFDSRTRHRRADNPLSTAKGNRLLVSVESGLADGPKRT